ncbi:MAG: 30S ribosomal protein S7 [Verrucomicrobia bacterium]|nr:30S ribosomal protein S7 [Verrucomicrobiota bacterium]MDA1085750.1 30S ribosomal protein S7 [Verrucomicrobiota bacterium]
MARRRRAERREPTPDPRYQSALVKRLINQVMRRGKKTVAENIVYGALEEVREKLGEDEVQVLQQAIDNVKPRVEVKSRRVGGATYQVPIEMSRERQLALAMRWVIGYSTARKGIPMRVALARELMDAYKGEGDAIKKRDDTHKMAQANRAFAHYRW